MMNFLDRVQTVASALVTYLVVASGVITTVMAQVDVPAVTQWGTTAVAWIAAAVAIIRRVSPVRPEERGLL